MNDRLWAKSWNAIQDRPVPDHLFLLGHLQHVLVAADRILEATADAQLRAFGIDSNKWANRFHRIVRLAAAVHDLGKANDHFQGMIARHPSRFNKPQGLRHEWVSWLIVQRAEIRNWLLPALGSNEFRDSDWIVMLWSISGHHPAFQRPSPPTEVPDGAGSEMQLLLGNPDFEACLNWLKDEFGLSSIPKTSDIQVSLSAAYDTIEREVSVIHAKVWEQWQESFDSQEIAAVVGAAKNCLVAADVAGSALPREITNQTKQNEWISKSFKRVPEKSDLDAIITNRLIDKVSGEVRDLRPFQRNVAEFAGEVTLVKAGCGSGKTLAAYHWVRERHPNRRLHICYPTTGTSTEGFRDYVFDESLRLPKIGARLFHGRADIDVKLILHVADQIECLDDGDEFARIEALDAWSTPVAICTVDTVLGVMQNNRRGLYSWPGFANAVFVFDEVHSYDANLFGALLRFIQSLRGVPVLLMTASLPDARLKRLKAAVKRRGSELIEISGPEELEILPRYHLGLDTATEDLPMRVKQEIYGGNRPGKVLWVCNTVDRAMKAADQCRSIGLNPLIYHSRFRYGDRVRQHGCVVDGFRDATQPSLAICTQVAEMSLDLSATLLVTEISPISALIQRLGRLNRRASSSSDPTMPFIVTKPLDKNGKMSELPYTIEELEEAQLWLSRLPGEISQRDLVRVWESLPVPTKKEFITSDCTWLDGGPRREVKELRNASIGITVMMQGDFDSLQSTERINQAQFSEFLIPMPIPRMWPNWKDWPEFRGVKVVQDEFIDYQSDRGAQWVCPAGESV